MNSAPSRRVYLSPEGWEHEVAPIMKFRLTYDGLVMSSQPLQSCRGDQDLSPKQERIANNKQMMRRHFHKQLKYLWDTHPTLIDLVYCKDCGVQNRHVARHSGTGIDGCNFVHIKEHMAQNFDRIGYSFCPLACVEFGLSCTLNILFLREGVPNGTVKAGDLDNRVKTVIDALTMPGRANQLGQYKTPDADESPFFCLLEDDGQVSSLTVESDTLLDRSLSSDVNGRDAKLVISVELRPYMPTHFNLAFA